MAFRRTEETADRICTLIADGYTLRQVAREMGMSRASDITLWAREDEDFRLRYARAKEEQMDHFAEEIVAISDDGSNDWLTREVDAGEIVTAPDHEHIQRSRLRVDSRKWLMAKMAPKRYGDQIAITGKDGQDLIPAEPDRGKLLLAMLVLLQGPRNPDSSPPASETIQTLPE